MGSKRFSTTLTQESADNVRATLEAVNELRLEREQAPLTMATFVAQALTRHMRAEDARVRAVRAGG